MQRQSECDAFATYLPLLCIISFYFFLLVISLTNHKLEGLFALGQCNIAEINALP